MFRKVIEGNWKMHTGCWRGQSDHLTEQCQIATEQISTNERCLLAIALLVNQQNGYVCILHRVNLDIAS